MAAGYPLETAGKTMLQCPRVFVRIHLLVAQCLACLILGADFFFLKMGLLLDVPALSSQSLYLIFAVFCP